MTSFATLRGLVRQPQAAERCDLCGTALGERHRHMLDLKPWELICTCDRCGLRFGGTKYKNVPQISRFLDGFVLSDGQWDSLMVPIGLAFFVKSSVGGKMQAFYPSPAGATESMLSLDAWSEIEADNPVLHSMEEDVEALLANRLNHNPEYYLAPIDKCYGLIGLIRANWHGLSGGTEMWTSVHRFLAGLKEDALA